MTMGELAKLFNAENKLGATLIVVPMQDWHRGDWFDSTGLPWVNPSPNMRSLKAATLYPGLCLMEYAKNYSVGRGTEAPFEQIGGGFPERAGTGRLFEPAADRRGACVSGELHADGIELQRATG